MNQELKKYIGYRFDHPRYGAYIITDVFQDIHDIKATVYFFNTEAMYSVRLSDAISLHVKDPQFKLSYNKIYYSNNYGPFKILEINDSSNIKIKFLITGYETINSASNIIITGNIKDYLLDRQIPLDIRDLDIEDRELRIRSILKSAWSGMHERCYKEYSAEYNAYGLAGVRVCERWHDFDNFYEDAPYLQQYEKFYRHPTLYQIDKDFLQLHLDKKYRVYSPQTCIFLYYLDNLNVAAIDYRMRNDTIFKYYGVRQCSKNAYAVRVKVNNHEMHIGCYSDEIVAANVFNYWYEKYHPYELVPLVNDVPYVSPLEFKNYRTAHLKGELCNRIFKNGDMCTIVQK